MNYQHKQLSSGKWAKLSFFEQMANVGSEVERAISWKKKGNTDYSRMAFERSLELLGLTIQNAKAYPRLKELCRLYEVIVDYFAFENQFKSSDELWHNYFTPFNYAARISHK